MMVRRLRMRHRCFQDSCYMVVHVGPGRTSSNELGSIYGKSSLRVHSTRSHEKVKRQVAEDSPKDISGVIYFRNIALTISGITDDEQFDRFCEGLKPEIKLEVLKSNAASFEEAVRIALDVDSAYYGMRLSTSVKTYESSESPTPMEIGNFQSSRKCPRKFNNLSMNQRKTSGFTGRSVSSRIKDLTQGTCFVCHKKGCRARFHEDNREVPQSNNASTAEAEEIYEISDQEN
jgi:hypothetical protein